MDTDTRSSGTKLFYQVKPSGQRRVLKMVPGKSIQTQTVVTSSVHVVRPKRPLTAVPLNHGHSKARVRPPEQLCISPTQSTSPMKTTLPALGTCIIRVPAPVQTSAPRNKRMLVAPVDKSPKIIIRFPTERNDKPNRSLSRSPVAPNPLTPRLEEANAIRSFTKVTNTANANCTANAAPMSEKQTRQLILRLPQRPNSPNKWVIEENGPNSSSSSSQTSGIGSEVMEVGATEKQPECSVLMWDDRVFFRVEKKIKTGGVVDVIDLCGEDEVGEAADTRARGGDEAQTGSRSEEGRGEETRSGPGDHSSSAQPRQRSGQRGRHSQKSSSSAASAEDHRLRQMFGITSEVQVRLPRLVLHDTGRSSASQAPPLDYTQPIEEDFLCDADPHHSQGCPQVEAAPSRVGRTRKRTRCPCCSPAALFRHRAHNRRSKPGGGDRREGVRKQLRLTPNTDPLTDPLTANNLVKLLPALLSAPLTSTLTNPPPAALTTLETTTTPVPVTPPVSGQTQDTPLPLPTARPSLPTVRLTLTTARPSLPIARPSLPTARPSLPTAWPPLPNTQPSLPNARSDSDCEELQIQREIQLLREALRLKEEALEKLKKKNA